MKKKAKKKARLKARTTVVKKATQQKRSIKTKSKVIRGRFVKKTKKKKPTARKPRVKLDRSKLTEHIQMKAYYIWESMGKPHGKDAEIWQQAEKEIIASGIRT